MKSLNVCELIAVAGLVTVVVGCSPTKSANSNATATKTLEAPPPPDFHQPVDYVEWYTTRNNPESAVLADAAYASCFLNEEPSLAILKQLNKATMGPWRTDSHRELSAYIASLRKPLEAFELATQWNEVRWDLSNMREAGCISGPRPSLKQLRAITKARLAIAWQDAAQTPNASDELIAAWRSILSCARHVDRRFGTGPCLFGMSLRVSVYRSMRNALQHQHLGPDQLSQALQLLIDDSPPSIAESFRAEMAVTYDLLQHLYPKGKFSITEARRLEQDHFPTNGAFLPAPDETAKKVAEYFDPIVACATRELSLANIREIERLTSRKATLAGNNNLLKLYLPSLVRIYQLAVACEMQRRGTATLFAVNVHYAHEEQWPDSLAKLRTRLDRALTIDPYSTEPFVYEIQQGEPRLYSIGVNGSDDGGVHHPKADSRGQGDFVFLLGARPHAPQGSSPTLEGD